MLCSWYSLHLAGTKKKVRNSATASTSSFFWLSRRLCCTLIVNSTTKLLQANIFHRGPAKGYIEGLEHRLHEAETLLLQLLPVVTPDQLSTAAANLNSTNADAGDSPDRFGARSSPPMLNKKTGIEYWENFPLDGVENIRRWQQDCALHSHFRDHDFTNGPGSNRGASRPSSVDLARENTTSSVPGVAARGMPNGKGSSLSQVTQPQYRSMSSDSYPPSHSQPEYISAPPASAPQQRWNNNPAYMEHWQSGMAMHPSHRPHQQQHSQQQMIPAGGPMEIDSGFFTNDVKRNLFW
jgi:hypothetical protein